MNEIKMTLSVANSRKSTQWVSRVYTWAQFRAACGQTKRTSETMEQYLAADKERQGRIKDVGGYMAGTLDGCRRKKAAVISRTAITLDLDFVYDAEQAWESVRQASGQTAVLVYSTHKHTPQSPRLRVVVPLKRPVTPEVYEPIARMWAKRLGVLGMCDSTTFEACRMFYWPSTSKDGEYFYRESGDTALEPTDALALYKGEDWRDAANWPVCSGETSGQMMAQRQAQAGKDQEDPLSKTGVVGAFCRAHFPIGQAIEELLPAEYDRAGQGRYTYTGSSTVGGLVTYDERFAYSHHNTDPACGQMCNIFDLCRIHMFGERDASARADRQGERLPSYVAMVEYATADPATKVELHRTRMAQAEEDFAGYVAPEEDDTDTAEQDEPQEPPRAEDPQEPDDGTWASILDCSKKTGEVLPTLQNFVRILENDPAVKGLIRRDLFACCDCRGRALPWNPTPGQWSDNDESNLRIYLDAHYHIYKRSFVEDALQYVVNKNTFHPIRDYLSGLPEWDGVPRLERVFCDYVGTEATILTREITRKAFVACVARVMAPGCKYDYCVVLQGPEGIGKSRILKYLGGKWFSDTLTTTEGKEGREQLQSKWIIEIGELDAIKRSEVTQIKNYISAQEDTYRPAYGRHPLKIPRQCVFFATTNELTFLKGENGNRRFWVIPMDPRFAKHKPEDVYQVKDQIWAEALHWYRQGEKLYLDKDLEKEARDLQADYNLDADDPLESMLDSFLETELPFNWETDYDMAKRRNFWRDPNFDTLESRQPRTRFCPAEFICERLGRDMGDREFKTLARRINVFMEKKEWVKVNLTRHAEKLYGRQRGYKRTDDDDQLC